MANTKATVKRVIAELFGVHEDQIKLEDRFAEELGGDSLDACELELALETELDREIPNGDITNLKTVGEVIAYCEKKLACAV